MNGLILIITLSSSVKKSLNNINNNRKILSQFNLEKFIYETFKKIYSNNRFFYNNINGIKEIICNEWSHVVAMFKHYLIIGDYWEFLQYYYKAH